MMNNLINVYLLQSGAAGSGVLLMLMLPIMFIAMLYFQQRKTKRWQEVLNNLKNGDRVTTSGGIRGLVIALKDDAVHLRVPPDNLRLEVAKTAITAINREEEEKKPS
ncbi:MAG: preprotein translocase subunit YajC [Terriglobales bacterium]